MFAKINNVVHQVCVRLLLQAHVLRIKNCMNPVVPAALASKCFPDLLQHGDSRPVQLYISLVTEDATQSTPTAAGKRRFLLVWVG
jgi:hypothetical protein